MTATANMFVLGAGVEWGTTLVTLATFVILLALLKVAWGPLKEVMDKRERLSIKILMMLNKLKSTLKT